MKKAFGGKKKRINREDFEEIKKIGQGAFGKVLLVRNRASD